MCMVSAYMILSCKICFEIEQFEATASNGVLEVFQILHQKTVLVVCVLKYENWKPGSGSGNRLLLFGNDGEIIEGSSILIFRRAERLPLHFPFTFPSECLLLGLCPNHFIIPT